MAVLVIDPDHSLLIEQIKAVGQELIRDAEHLIPDMERVTSFSITVDFPIPSRSGIPEITVMTGITSGKFIDDVIEVEGKYKTTKHKSGADNE